MTAPLERRFRRVWEDMEARVDAGEPLNKVLDEAKVTELVAALSAAGATNAVAANAIATEVLNRIRRAPFLGAAIASLAAGLVLVVSDLLYTGWPLFATATLRTYTVLAYSAIATVFSAFMWLMWRGHFPRVRYLIEHRRKDW